MNLHMTIGTIAFFVHSTLTCAADGLITLKSPHAVKDTVDRSRQPRKPRDSTFSCV